MKKFLTICLTAGIGAMTAAAAIPAPQAAAPAEGRRPLSAAYPCHRHKADTRGIRHIQQTQAKAAADTRMAVRQSPAKRITSGGANIYGYLYYTEDPEFMPQMCELDAIGYTPIWDDPVCAQGAEVSTGWLRDGVLYSVATVTFGDMVFGAYNVRQDFYTGEIMEVKQLGEEDSFFSTAALNEADGHVYGVYAGEEGWMWGKAPSGAIEMIEPICEADNAHTFSSLTFNTEDNTLYGINILHDFVKIANDGEITVLRHVELEKPFTSYMTGLIYSNIDKCFYWNVNYEDETAALYTIDPQTYEFTLAEEYDECEEFIYFVTPDRKLAANAPEASEIKSIDFGKGDLSGTITYQLPSTLADGSSYTGDLTWTAYLDNERYSSGTAKAGSEVSVKFEGLETGRHSFGFVTAANGSQSRQTMKIMFIGKDTPEAPENVILTDKMLSWDPVTTGVQGGYIDRDALIYRVYSGEDEVASTKECYIDITLPTDKEMQAYNFSVSAEYGDIYVSEQTPSNYVIAGTPFTIPTQFEPTRLQSMLFTVDDVNCDGRGWGFDSGVNNDPPTDPAFRCMYGLTASDDWLFMPAIDFPSDDRFYTLSFMSRIAMERYPLEYLEVYVGSAPDPEEMTRVVLPKFTPAVNYTAYEAYVRVEKPGVNYIGFHCTSAPDMAGIMLRDIRISDNNIPLTTPSPATDLKAEAGENGALNATVSFTMPLNDISGAPLDKEAVLTATVTGKTTETVTGNPGERLSATVETVQGKNNISITVSYSDSKSLPATVEVFTGQETPAQVKNLRYELSSNMMSVTLTWDPVDKGVLGGYIDPSTVTYDICILRESMFGYYWENIDEDITETTYTYTLPTGSMQEFIQIGVATRNVAGTSEEVTNISTVIGTPYRLPMSQDFGAMDADSQFSINPFVTYDPDDTYIAEWVLATPSQLSSSLTDREGYYLVCTGDPGAKGRIGLPRFSTLASNAVFELSTLTFTGFVPVSIYAECEGVPMTLIGKVEKSNITAPVKHQFRLPDEFDAKAWVQIYLDATMMPDQPFAAIRDLKVSAVNGVEELAESTVAVTSGNGYITVTGAEGKAISIVTPDGRTAARRADAAATETFRLPAGIYIVSAAGRSVKTAVK